MDGPHQNFPSLSTRTRKGESLGPGLVSVSDSTSKFRDAQDSDSVSDSSLRFVQCFYQNGGIIYSFLKGKRENRTQSTEILVLRLVSDSVSDSIFINGPDSESESVSYLRLKQSQNRNRDSKMGTRKWGLGKLWYLRTLLARWCHSSVCKSSVKSDGQN